MAADLRVYDEPGLCGGYSLNRGAYPSTEDLGVSVRLDVRNLYGPHLLGAEWAPVQLRVPAAYHTEDVLISPPPSGAESSAATPRCPVQSKSGHADNCLRRTAAGFTCQHQYAYVWW